MDDERRLAIEGLLAEHSRWEVQRTERLRKASDLAARLRQPAGRSPSELEAAMDELRRIIDPTSPEPLTPADRRPSSTHWPRSTNPHVRPPQESGKFDEDDDEDDLDRPNLPPPRQ